MKDTDVVKPEANTRKLDTDLFRLVLASLPVWKEKIEAFYELYETIKPDCQELAKQSNDLVLGFFTLYEQVKIRTEEILNGETKSRGVFPEQVEWLAQKVANEIGKESA